MKQYLLLVAKIFLRIFGTMFIVATIITLLMTYVFKADADVALIVGMVGGLVVLKLQGWVYFFTWLFRTVNKQSSYCASCHQPVDLQWKRCGNCGATWK